MKRSTDRLLVTHVGSLPRPRRLLEFNAKRMSGEPADSDELESCLSSAVRNVVKRQEECGINVSNDGEFGKASRNVVDYGAWMSYAYSRLEGFTSIPEAGVATGRSRTDVHLTTAVERRDRKKFPTFYKDELPTASFSSISMRPMCTAPIRYTGHAAVRADIDHLRAALDGRNLTEAFISAIAPGSFARGQNQYYETEEAFLEAIGDAMRTEYQAIIEAGFILQLDDPGLPDTWDMTDPEPSLEEYRAFATQRVEALNYALRGLPEDRIRYHICWGSWHGPHTTDLPLSSIVDIMLKVRAQAYSVEAANVRHEHEWRVWETAKLPEGKILIPGVVSHGTNLVEHPQLIADRLVRLAQLVGRENVIASTDCGLGGRVHEEIAWAKLDALVEGTELASRQLWGR